MPPAWIGTTASTTTATTSTAPAAGTRPCSTATTSTTSSATTCTSRTATTATTTGPPWPPPRPDKGVEHERDGPRSAAAISGHRAGGVRRRGHGLDAVRRGHAGDDRGAEPDRRRGGGLELEVLRRQRRVRVQRPEDLGLDPHRHSGRAGRGGGGHPPGVARLPLGRRGDRRAQRDRP